MWVNPSLYPAPVPAPGLQPAAEPQQWPVAEVEPAPAPAPLIPPPVAPESVSPPSAVLELEQGPASAPAGVAAPELESPGPPGLMGIPSPAPKIQRLETQSLPAPGLWRNISLDHLEKTWGSFLVGGPLHTRPGRGGTSRAGLSEIGDFQVLT
nr:ral guanine nucleotide dissociation stimulator isoform X4 [Equus caballus]